MARELIKPIYRNRIIDNDKAYDRSTEKSVDYSDIDPNTDIDEKE